jgi:hypothetical protein
MAKDLIGYEALADKAMRSIVKEALKRTEKQGLLGSHHFYLTFKTKDPGVEIPEFLLERYPEEMTIVLQNQYWGLKVREDEFAALTAFVDPSVQFGLQFRNSSAAKKVPAPQRVTKDAPKPPAPREAPKDASVETLSRKPAKDVPSAAEESPEKPSSDPQVVSFDKFRKK